MTEVSQGAARYHINPDTGNVNQCRARYSCRFGDFATDHYSTKEKALAAVEDRLTAEFTEPKAAIKGLEMRALRHEPLDFDAVAVHLEYAQDNKAEWTREEKENLQRILRLQALLEQDPFPQDGLTDAMELRDGLHAYHNRFGRRSDDWDRRNYHLVQLAQALVLRKRFDLLPAREPAPLRRRNEALVGLESAQEEHFKTYNEKLDLSHSDGNFRLGPTAGAHLQATLDWVAAGEEPPVYFGERGEEGLMAEEERLLTKLSPESPGFENQIYMSLAWPDNELREAMERTRLSQVTVGTFFNGRESGNVYTVLQPDGTTRSFSVYEHRNSDSIIINGKADWPGDNYPYASESKYEFFAEFAAEDRPQAASALTFYLREAQKGELPDDATLASQAQKRDWISILSASAPGFGQWHADRFGPRDPDLDDPLKRLGL
jgi:hypothetical protein